MSKTTDTRNKARLSIMSDILQFYTSKDWKDGRPKSPGIEGFIPADTSVPDSDPRPGDLVILKAAPPSKWNIGWLRKIKEEQFTHYLIESLEDGELCWWTNIGLDIFPRDKIRARWEWTDKQYEFQARWARTYHKHGEGKALEALFVQGGPVTLSCRGYWDFSDTDAPPPITRTFPNWKKVTVQMMKEAIAEMDAERKALK